MDDSVRGRCGWRVPCCRSRRRTIDTVTLDRDIDYIAGVDYRTAKIVSTLYSPRTPECTRDLLDSRRGARNR